MYKFSTDKKYTFLGELGQKDKDYYHSKLQYPDYPIKLYLLNQNYFKKTVLDALKPLMVELHYKAIKFNRFKTYKWKDRRIGLWEEGKVDGSTFFSHIELKNTVSTIVIRTYQNNIYGYGKIIENPGNNEALLIKVDLEINDESNSVENRKVRNAFPKILKKLGYAYNKFIKDGNMMMSSPLRSYSNMFLGPAEKSIGTFLGIKLAPSPKRPNFLNGGRSRSRKSKSAKRGGE